MWEIGGREISSIAVVDDQPESRESLGWVLADSDLEMLDVTGPLASIDFARRTAFDSADALICDHHLSARNYASFSGAELVAASTREGCLAVLCTRFIGPDIDSIRPLMPHIPVVRRPDELNEPDELRVALDTCAAELDGNPTPQRRLWRAQLVVERIEDDLYDMSIPSWPIDETIRIRAEDVPTEIQPQIEDGFRAYGWVNLGAESPDHLFIGRWDN